MHPTPRLPTTATHTALIGLLPPNHLYRRTLATLIRAHTQGARMDLRRGIAFLALLMAPRPIPEA